ncbi:hypothetical protein GCM10022419_126180 [Nonomuraea rosea]|uniref:DUF4190 domain-containing protein n=2 Tax=Nonomuraea rosea TaxID=638574 RepID=A0ABP6ZVU5_9ACTN
MYTSDADAGRAHPAGPPTSGLAVASLIFGIAGLVGSWCLLGIPSIAAVVLGHAATRQTKRGLRPGHGLAVAGLILGYVVAIPAIIVSVIFGVMVFVHPAQAAAWFNGVLDWFF